jgi:hypothetical protein
MEVSYTLQQLCISWKKSTDTGRSSCVGTRAGLNTVEEKKRFA